jgi:signal transduction histidine kinase
MTHGNKNCLKEDYRELYQNLEFYCDIFLHNMNNILNGIQNYIFLTLKHLNDKDKINELNNSIIGYVKKGTELVKNLRKIYKFEEYKKPLIPIDLCYFLKEAVKKIPKFNENGNIHIQIESKEEEVIIKANDLIINIFENILLNAIKYNDKETILIFVQISKKKTEKIDYVRIEFKDNGIGIPEKGRKELFKKNHPIQRKSYGMGIGLLLVKKILKLYKGKISVKERIQGDFSQGSNFIIDLPLVRKNEKSRTL